MNHGASVRSFPELTYQLALKDPIFPMLPEATLRLAQIPGLLGTEDLHWVFKRNVKALEA